MFEDFPQQVPFTSDKSNDGIDDDNDDANEEQDDWLQGLQLLDLPQLFSFPDPSASINLGADISKDLSKQLMDDVATPESQHTAPGPIRTPPHTQKLKESSDSPVDNNKKHALFASVSREELLRFTSEDLEAYVKSITATRALTPSEHKEIKKQRRLIRNRESAQQSRKRKKDKVGDLEVQVAELQGINQERKAKLDDLEAENVILKAEVAQLVNVIKESPALSSLLINVTSWMVMYTLSKAVTTHNVQQALIPPIIQQQFLHLPTPRAIC